jgi:formylglycine-generating enzyme required for sulfatase activity
LTAREDNFFNVEAELSLHSFVGFMIPLVQGLSSSMSRHSWQDDQMDINAVHALIVRPVCLVATIVCFAAVAHAEQRLALIIGNSAYGASLGYLPNPTNDARLIGETLEKLGFTVEILLDADQRAMKRAISAFGERLERAGKDGIGLFYYAGHGMSVNGTDYLIPVQAEIAREPDVESEAVRADWVLAQMEYARNLVNIVVLDACRNNPLTRSFRSLSRGLVGLQRQVVGTYVAYSADYGQVAEDGAGANSPFAEALARNLPTPAVDIDLMFRNVRGAVLQATGGRQLPKSENSLTGAFHLIPEDVPATPAPAFTASAGADKEAMFWAAIGASEDPVDYAAYLEQFPEGTFARLAKRKLDSLMPGLGMMEGEPARASPPGRPPTPPSAGTTFRDCESCPLMTVLPAGAFTMGSPSYEAGRDMDEEPQRAIEVPSFAIGIFEITFAEWDACLAAGGCNRHAPDDMGWGRGSRPVVNVDHGDAEAYAAWLSRKTGQSYRLPSEAEWEYAARAGTSTPYAFDATLQQSDANFGGTLGRTMPVGSYRANAFGLYDMHGNAAEWVADCWLAHYGDGPTDADARITTPCKARLVRGGSALNSAANLRSAARIEADPAIGAPYIGFRVVRDLKN